MFEFFWLLLRLVFWLRSRLAPLTTGDWWAYGSALVVLLGVIGETIADPDLTKSVKSERRRRIVARASALVLILGLAGDVISIHLTQLATASLNKEAADARRDAGNAQFAAGAANMLAQGTAVQAANANERAGKAIERGSANEKKAARLTKENLVLQAEVLKLRERIADRHLTSEQQLRIAKSLCGFGGINVDIGLYNSDGEIQKLGQEMNGALPEFLPEPCQGKPGFVVSVVMKLATIGFSGIQIILKQGTTQKSKAFASALAATLKQEGLQVEGPMAEPKRGNVMLGGSSYKRALGVGIEQGVPVEIAIGKKP